MRKRESLGFCEAVPWWHSGHEESPPSQAGFSSLERGVTSQSHFILSASQAFLYATYVAGEAGILPGRSLIFRPRKVLWGGVHLKPDFRPQADQGSTPLLLK